MKGTTLLLFVCLVASQNVNVPKPDHAYHLDSTSGNVIIDYADAVTPIDGVLYGHGSANWNPNGKINGCFNFAAVPVRGYFENPFAKVLSFTASFWMQTLQPAPRSRNDTDPHWWVGEGIIDADIPYGNNDWGISLLENKVVFGMGPVDKTISSKSDVVKQGWVHVVAVRSVKQDEPRSNTMRLYINGKLEDELTSTDNIEARTGEFVSIGALNTHNNFFNGMLDEMAFWKVDLSAAQVQKLYETENAWKPGVTNFQPIYQTVEVKIKNNNTTAIAIFMGVFSFVMIFVVIALLVWHNNNKKSGAYVSQVDRQ
jgi:hypothetical protein